MPIENKCPLCGKINPNTEWYCESCGAKLPLFGNRAATEGETPRPNAPRPVSPTPVPNQNAGLASDNPVERSRRAWKLVAVPTFLGLLLFTGGIFRFMGAGTSSHTLPEMPTGLTGTTYQVLRSQDFPRHVDVYVAVAKDQSKADLQAVADKVVAADKSGKSMNIWFTEENGTRTGRTVASYDSKYRDLNMIRDFSKDPAPVAPAPIVIATTAPLRPSESLKPGRITGALCADGTHSGATGRGACSHHGGVLRWTTD